MGKVYIMEANGLYKVGITHRSVAERVAELQTGNPYKISEVLVVDREDYANVEADIHAKYRHCRLVGEWFEFTSDELRDVTAYILDERKFVPTTTDIAKKRMSLCASITTSNGSGCTIPITFTEDQINSAAISYILEERREYDSILSMQADNANV